MAKEQEKKKRYEEFTPTGNQLGTEYEASDTVHGRVWKRVHRAPGISSLIWGAYELNNQKASSQWGLVYRLMLSAD